MAKKSKDKPEPIPVRRRCDCWIDVYSCFCELEKYRSIRYSVLDSYGDVHSRWDTLKEAMEDIRSRRPYNYSIYDNIENKIVLTYEK